MEKILTIIVPSYNMGKVLKQNLNSLIIDEFLLKKIEVLVINDGSTDNTLEVARKFEVTYPDVFLVVDKENGNYGSCINRGLDLAKGTFVKILDADDCFNPIAFEKFIRELICSEQKNENVDAFFTDYNTIDQEGIVGNCITTELPVNKVIELNEYFANICFSGIAHHKLTYRVTNLKKIGYRQAEGISYTDTEWFLLPFFNVKTVKYLPISVYKYLVGREGQSMDPKVLEKSITSFIKLGKELITKFGLYKKLYGTPIIDSIGDRLFEYISSIYKYYIMNTMSCEVMEQLLEFDEWLKENCNDYYKLLDKQIYSRKYPVRCVKLFRDGYTGRRFRMTVSIYRLLKRIKN